MIHLAGESVDITPASYVEGPFMAKHVGRYVFMWSEGNWTDSTYRVAYAIADSPYGPFERIGAILGVEPGIADGAGHHSVLQIPGTKEFVMCYHRRVLGDTNPHHRVTCLEKMRFDENGFIEPIKLTNEGVPAVAAH
jgi:beta-xylosidase